MRRCGDSNSRVTHSSRKALNPFAENSLTMASPFDSELGAVVITSLSWDWIPQICKRTPTCINAFNQLGHLLHMLLFIEIRPSLVGDDPLLVEVAENGGGGELLGQLILVALQKAGDGP